VFACLAPRPVDIEERLAALPTTGLPIERDLVIRWNAHHVPFIEAETDHDAAFAVGMIHAHLRAGQIALFTYLFDGRLAELFGPPAKKLDHALRILDFGHAADVIEQSLPDETKVWIQRFLDGMNHYQMRPIEPPPEYGLLGIKPRPYTMRDAIAGGRLASTDFTWLTYLSLLPRRHKPGFAQLWNRTLEAGESPIPGIHPEEAPAELEDLLLGAGRAGSNSFAVAPARSATGGALIANDPHLGLSLPNLWILAGLRSPSYHLIGFMIPGTPVFALGRNPHLAWGGTNLRAASSDLYDVGGLPADEIESRETVIRARFGRPSTMTLRRTRFGPIISDAKALGGDGGRPIAMRWVGHEATDEFTAFLRAGKARTPEEFREAFSTYGISGQTMVFADQQGNIGKIMAVMQPRRNGFPKDDPVLDATDPETHWQGLANVMDLPWVLNPPSGVLASANERPEGTDIPIGFTFGSEDRIRRLYELLSANEHLSVDDLSAMQADTRAPDAAVLAAALTAEIDAVPGGTGEHRDFLASLHGWNGDYDAGSAGAVAFETLIYHLVPTLYGGGKASKLPDLLGQWSYLTTYLLPDLMALDAPARHKLLKRSVRRAAKDAARYRTWGDMHRLRIGNTLARMPVVGRSLLVGDYPVGGSRQTPLKMAHGLVNRRHVATFGQMARHVSDLSDPDANWFVILGGNDGWIGSDTYADQVELWRQRRYMRMPMRSETVAAEFPHVTRMTAAAGTSAGGGTA
jgi:penicillin amidase